MDKCKKCVVRDNYIKFLGKHISDNATYMHMHIHNMGPSEKIIKEGIELRSKIKEADNKVD